MKKIFLTLIIFTIPCFLVAKKSSQLVFKSVKTFVHDEPTSNGGYSNKFYKPDSGYVWKIEKIINGGTSSGDAWAEIVFNQTRINISYFDNKNPFPLWIGENDSFSFYLRPGGNSFLVSALEFQVVD